MNILNVDMWTIFIVIIFGHVSTAVLITTYKHKHNSKTVNLFLFSKILQPLGWLMLGLRYIYPGIVLKIFGNLFLFVGVILELISFLKIKNSFTKTVKIIYGCIFILGGAAFAISVLLNFTDSSKIALASVFMALFIAIPAYILAMVNSSLMQKTIAFFYGISILFLFIRAYKAMTIGLDMNLSSNSLYNNGLFLLTFIIMTIGSVGFILLDKEKLDIELIRAASTDDLTNILNRRAFMLRAKEIISLFARRNEPISYLLIDIDDFKKINDTYGHYVGDIILKKFAEAVKKLLRNYDLFGRYGGEEFAVLLPGANEAESLEIAERLRKSIEESTFCVDFMEIKYTISIGIATIIPNRETNVDILYKISDDALYSAKVKGKNCVIRLQEESLK